VNDLSLVTEVGKYLAYLTRLQCYFGYTNDPKNVMWTHGADHLDKAGLVNQHGLSRKVSLQSLGSASSLMSTIQKHIISSVDRSLERLGLDYIDVFQCKFGSATAHII